MAYQRGWWNWEEERIERLIIINISNNVLKTLAFDPKCPMTSELNEFLKNL